MIYFQLYLISVLCVFLWFVHIRRQNDDFMANWGRLDFANIAGLCCLSLVGALFILWMQGRLEWMMKERSWRELKKWYCILYFGGK